MRKFAAFSALFVVVLLYGIIIYLFSGVAGFEMVSVMPKEAVVPEMVPLEPLTVPSGGWPGVIVAPAVFSSEALEEMIALAPHYTFTRIPHPERVMTEAEREAWITEYYLLGGLNAQELELYKIVNNLRANYDIPPFVLCPRLSMASRLFSYLQVKYHTVGHYDNYYDDFMHRANFFSAFGSLYMENANSQHWYVFPDGSIEYVYLSPQQLVDGWMDSEGHRNHILTRETTHVGFGVDSGRNRVVPTMKTILPLE